MARRRQIYEGKAKILYEGPEPGTLIQYFKDDATAFNAQKKGTINGKGVLNNRISEHIFTMLDAIGVPNHFIRRLNMREQLIRQVEIVPIEVVVRNVAAGSPRPSGWGSRRGRKLPRTIIEYYYKDDALGDPMISDEHIAAFGWASQEEMHDISDLAIRVNDFLSGLFAGIGIKLVDFKLEFGRIWDNDFGRIILADEISPDGCRLWDAGDQREARQGPVPPGSRRRGGGVSGGRAAAGAAARRRRTFGARPRQPPQAAGEIAVKVRVVVTLKPGVLDPQGRAIAQALGGLGFAGVEEARVGKLIELTLADGSDAGEVDSMCRRLLANPVIENYRIEQA